MEPCYDQIFLVGSFKFENPRSPIPKINDPDYPEVRPM